MKATRLSILFGALAFLVLASELSPRGSAAVQELPDLPLQGVRFSGRPIPVSDWEKGRLQGAEAMKRLYCFDGDYFVLTAIDGSQNRHAVHDPALCLRGSGFVVEKEETVEVAGQSFRQLRVRKGETVVESLMWFQAGERHFASFPRYWWEATRRRLPTLGEANPEPVFYSVTAQIDAGCGRAPDWSKVVADWLPQLGF